MSIAIILFSSSSQLKTKTWFLFCACFKKFADESLQMPLRIRMIFFSLNISAQLATMKVIEKLLNTSGRVLSSRL